MAVAIRSAEDLHVPAMASIAREADDARVLSDESLHHMRRTRPARSRPLEIVAVDGERVVGTGTAALDLHARPGTAWANVAVTHDRRGEGIGSTLGEALLDHLRALDATTVTSFTRQSDDGEQWAGRRGWSRALSGPLIAVDPRTATEPPKLPEGLRCVALAELGPEAVYETVREASFDEPAAVPQADFPYDDFLRDWHNPDVDLSSSAAVLDGDRVVAFSFLKAVGDRGQHGFTGTARDHRGLGLATAAKQRVLRSAAARGVTRVTTSNAEDNAAMRAVNRRLGFEPIGEHIVLSRTL